MNAPRHLPLVSLALSILSANAAGQAPPGATAALQQDLVALARRVLPSIVTVRAFVRGDAQAAGGPGAATPPTAGWVAASSDQHDYPGFVAHGGGSGFFVGEDGDVLTALQPLQVDGDRLVDLVEIESADGHRAIAEVVGIEPTLHLAVLRRAVSESVAPTEARALPFGDSEALEPGSLLFGCGDPPGPERCFAPGLLVAKPSRDCYQELMSATYMQASMLVPDGAIGGPLVDLDGRVVGILSRMDVPGVASAPSSGSAWALPSKLLTGLYESIRAAGTTMSPWLGFAVMSRAEIAATRGFAAFQQLSKPPHGILIENVFTPSPAETAGLRPGDFLTHFDGVEIHQPVQFQRQLYLAGVGREVTLTFWRAGEPFTKQLVVERRPAEATPR